MGVYQKVLERIDTETVYEFLDGDMGYLPVDRISAKDDFNPRKEFIESEMDDLIEDVKQRGVIQPIIVRKNKEVDGHFWVIAGERRWRASKEVELPIIPVIFRDVSEVEAIALAKSENTERSDMGVIGEAFACREALMACSNDHQEAANHMRMSLTIFSKRLLLLHAEPETQRALGRKQIKIGHAELLVGLPKEQQIDTVKAIIEKGMNNVPVADLKRSIEGFVMNLSEAKFNTVECNDCIHNSTKQAGLFDDNVGEGKCSNHVCYQEKTHLAVEGMKEELLEKFNTVYLDTEITPDSYTFVEKTEVGVEQYSACKGCVNFGALLKTKAGEAGSITKGICFNLECHAKKLKANTKTVKADQKAEAEGQVSADISSDSENKVTEKSKMPTKAEASNETPKVVIEWIDNLLLGEAVNELMSEDDKIIEMKANHVCQALSVAQMLGSHSISSKCDNTLLDSFKLDKGLNMSARLQLLIALDEKDLRTIRNEAAIAFLKSECTSSLTNPEGIKASIKILDYFKVKIAERFKIDEAFMKGHTTAGIMSLLEEKEGMASSFAEWVNKVSDGGFIKLMKKTKPKIIEEVLESDFGFVEFIPRCISQRIDKLSKHK